MTFLPFLSHLSIVGFIGILAAAALSDLRNLTIPNRYCLAIALLYPAYLLSAGQPVDWLGALVVAGSMLAAGFVLFAVHRRRPRPRGRRRGRRGRPRALAPAPADPRR